MPCIRWLHVYVWIDNPRVAICVFIGLGLLTSNGIEGHQRSPINSSDIPKVAINNLLYLFISLIIHRFTAVFRDYILCLLVILLWL